MAAGIELYNDVLNQKGSPALYSDIFANRPAFGYTGRLFISTDTNEIYRDTGTSWVLISSGGGGTNIYNSNGTLTGTRTLTNGGFDLIFTGGANAFNLDFDANTNLARTLSFTTASVDRWKFQVTDNETGTNAGSNLYLKSYNDAGTFTRDSIYIERATGEISIYSEDILGTNGANLSGIYNVARGTYTTSSYTGGNPQGALFNIFTFDPRTNLTFANSQFVSTYSNVCRLEPTDTQTVTMSQGTGGIRTMGPGQNQIQYNIPATKTLTVSHLSNYTSLGIYELIAGGNLTATNAYHIVLNDLNEYTFGTLTLTNRWGIYQAGANDINYFNANTLFGTTTNAGYKVDVSGTARVTQSAYFATASGNAAVGTTNANFGGFSKCFSINRNAGTTTGLEFLSSDAGEGYIFTRSDSQAGLNIWRVGTNPIVFFTNSNERLRIFGNGNVRIASSFTDNGALLQVAGNVSVTTGDITLDNNKNIQFGGTTERISGSASNNTLSFITNNGTRLYIDGSANVGMTQTSFGTGAARTLAISTGVAPGSSPADCFQLYSADITAGNAAAHFRTENGAIVKVYQETTAVGSATISSPGGGVNLKDDDTFDGYTIAQVVKALRNQGLLA